MADKKKWRVQRPDGTVVEFYGPRDMDYEQVGKASEFQAQLDQQKKATRMQDLANKYLPQTNAGLGKLAAGYSEFMNEPLLPQIQTGEQYFKTAQPAANTMEAIGQGVQGFGRDVYNEIARPFSSPTGLLSLAVPAAGLVRAARPAAALATRALPGLMSAAAAPGAVMDINQAIQDPTLQNVTGAMSSTGNTLLGLGLTRQLMRPQPTPPVRTIPYSEAPALPPANVPPQGLLGIGGAEYQPPQRPFNPDPNAPIPGYPPPQRLLPPAPEPFPEGLSDVNPMFGTARFAQQMEQARQLPPAPEPSMTQRLERGPIEPLPEMPAVPGVEFAKERRSRVERLQPDVLEPLARKAAEEGAAKVLRTVERPTVKGEFGRELEPPPAFPPKKEVPGQKLEGFENTTYEGEMGGADLYKYGGKEGNNFSVKKGASQQEFLDAYNRAKEGYESRIANQAPTRQPAPEQAPLGELPPKLEAEGEGVRPTREVTRGPEPVAFEPRTVGEHVIEESGNPKVPYQLRKGNTVIARGLKPDSFDAYLKRDAELQRKLKEIDDKYGDLEEEPTKEPSDIPEGFQEEEIPQSRVVERPSKKKEVKYPLASKRPGERGSIRLFTEEGEEPLKSNLRAAFRPGAFKEDIQPTSELFKILNKGGISTEEKNISQINQFLLDNPRKFSVSALNKWLDEHQVVLQERKVQDVPDAVKVEYNATGDKIRKLSDKIDSAYHDVIGYDPERGVDTIVDKGYEEYLQNNPNEWPYDYESVSEYLKATNPEYAKSTEQLAAYRRRMGQLQAEMEGGPKFADSYTEAGPRTKQEETTQTFEEPSKKHYGLTPEETAEFEDLSMMSELTPEQLNKWRDYNTRQRAYHEASQLDRAMRYRPPDVHAYGQEIMDLNRMVHSRYDQRNFISGESTTHIAEIQSDWVNAMRKEGTFSRADKLRHQEVVAKLEELSKQRNDMLDANPGNYKEIHNLFKEKMDPLVQERRDLNIKLESKTPEPPALSNDWIDFTMRRMLVQAAKNGSEYLSWPIGDTVADRYYRRHAVDEIQWEKFVNHRGETTYNLNGYKEGSHKVAVTFKEKALASKIGKEKADEIINSGKNEGILENLPEGTKLGGEWAINQYDAKMPNYIRDLAKKNKWQDVQVEQKAIPTKYADSRFAIQDAQGRFMNINDAGELVPVERIEDIDVPNSTFSYRSWAESYANRDPNLRVVEMPGQLRKQNKVWAVKITPEMRDQLTAQGLPTSGEKLIEGAKVRDRSGERGSFSRKPAEGPSDMTKKLQDLTTPIADVIAGLGPAGKAIARAMTRARLVGEHYAGTWEQRAKDALEGISDEEFGTVNAEGKVRRGNVIDTLEGNAEPANAKIRTAANAIRELLDETGSRAEGSGMSLRVGDKNVPFEKRSNYFPHLYTEQFWNRIKNDENFKEKILQRIVAQNEGMTMDAASKLLQRARQFGERLIDPQHERVFNLPGWERSKGALFKHLHDMGRQIGNAEELGPKDIAGPRLDKLIKKTTDPEYAYELLKRALKRDEPPQVRDVKIANKITTAASWAYLSRAAIGNMAQLTRVPAHASFTSAAKAFGQYLTDRQGFYRDSLSSGAIVEIGAKGLMEEFGSKSRAYKTYGIEQSEKFLRSIASAAGRSEAEAAFRVLKENPADKRARVQLTDLLQENVDRVLEQNKLTDKQSNIAGGRMAELTQGRAEAMDLPKNWSGSPYANLYFLYKKYALQDTRNMWKAIKKNPGKALATIAVLNQAAGETVGDIKEALKGFGKGLVTGDIGKNISEKVSGRGAYLMPDNPQLGRFFDNYLQSWTFGVLSDALQNIKKGEFAGTIGEMASDVVTSIGATGKRIVEGKESPVKPLAKTAVGMVPVLGPGIREGMFPKEEPKKRKARPTRVVRRPVQRSYSP